MRTRLIMLLAATLTAMSSGCAPRAITFLTPPEPPVVWPKSPDAPRVRYVGELTGSKDIGAGKSFGEVWDEVMYGPKPPEKLLSPQAVAVHAGGQKVAVADVNGKCVHVFDLAAQKYAAMVMVGSQAMECPVGVSWAGDVLWAADANLHGLAVWQPGGAGRWVGTDRLKRPGGLTYCGTNQLSYVCDAGADRVLAFDSAGNVVLEFGSRGAGPGQFNGPLHIAWAADNTLVVSDALNGRVQRFGIDGSPLGQFGRQGDAPGDLALPKGVAVDRQGAIWVVDARFENVQAFSGNGDLLLSFGKEGRAPGEFWLPAGCCIDSMNRMWVADSYNRRVQVFALLQ